ncbi:E3 ubiquitin-protein ligase RNF4-like [Sander lucioperca]|uniref:E3 ubiquitin-protein ligase RNF4-like n=1 Tax=Sander lucioperca TaxID=283035 RepID=UPI0016539AA2|nr:E3 ubiquitin-protein ligase RNF4-like [Sander lucioperca]
MSLDGLTIVFCYCGDPPGTYKSGGGARSAEAQLRRSTKAFSHTIVKQICEPCLAIGSSRLSWVCVSLVCLCSGVEEVVDLTCEGSEAVVDLTNNDSVLLVDEGPQTGAAAESYVVSSDEDEATPPALNAAVMSSARTNGSSRSTPGTISCPVCLDSYSEIVESGRLVVSTRCGHVFCSMCLRDALKNSPSCPSCRKRLTARQYHPLYV